VVFGMYYDQPISVETGAVCDVWMGRVKSYEDCGEGKGVGEWEG